MITRAQFTEAQLAKLRAEYATIKTVDPSGETYGKVCEFLDGLSTDLLKQLAEARIPWVSSLARNRYARRDMSAEQAR